MDFEQNVNQPYTCTLSEAAIKKAEVELNEDPSTRGEKLNHLKEMFKSRPDIRFRQDDAFLLRFLRNKKFEVDRAFKSLIHHYQVRRDYKDIFTNYRPSAVKCYFDLPRVTVCLVKGGDGRYVLISRGGLDLKKCSVLDGTRAVLMMVETMLEDEDIQVNGIVFINDSDGLTLNIIKQCNPFLMKRTVDSYANALPMRIKEAHFICRMGILRPFFALIKQFLPEKIKSRLHVHDDDVGSLHKYVPSALLPVELGGQLPGYDNTEWVNKTLAAEEEFIYNEQFGFIKSK